MIRGKNTTSESVQFAGNYEAEAGVAAEKRTSTATATALSDYIYNCSDCLNGNWTVNKSLVWTNGEADHVVGSSPAHFEPIYWDGGQINIENSTLFNPVWQTSIFHNDTKHNGKYQPGPCYNKALITKSLLAGAGFLFYKCGNAEGTGSATITKNHIARCTETAVEDVEGHRVCKGTVSGGVSKGDKTGYYPEGGSYGISATGRGGPGPTGNGLKTSGTTISLRCRDHEPPDRQRRAVHPRQHGEPEQTYAWRLAAASTGALEELDFRGGVSLGPVAQTRATRGAIVHPRKTRLRRGPLSGSSARGPADATSS